MCRTTRPLRPIKLPKHFQPRTTFNNTMTSCYYGHAAAGNWQTASAFGDAPTTYLETQFKQLFMSTQPSMMSGGIKRHRLQHRDGCSHEKQAQRTLSCRNVTTYDAGLTVLFQFVSHCPSPRRYSSSFGWFCHHASSCRRYPPRCCSCN